MANVEAVPLINYYAHAGYYRHMQNVCNDVLKKQSNNTLLIFWRAVGMLKEGQAGEAIRELENILRRNDVQLMLPAKIALLHAHRACQIVDSEAVTRLETDLMGSEDDTSVPDRARMQAALLFWHLGECVDAKQHVTTLLRLQSTNVQALVLLGWLEIAAAEQEISGIKFDGSNGDPSEEFAAAGEAFEKAISAGGGKRDLEAMMGQARLMTMQGRHKDALDHLSQVSEGLARRPPRAVSLHPPRARPWHCATA